MRRPRPALLALGIALLLLVKALGAPVLASAAAAGADSAASIFTKICHAANDADSGAAHQHSDCCIICQAESRDGVLLFLAACFIAILLFPRVAATRRVRALKRGERPPRESGFASSWSSQAPPHFS